MISATRTLYLPLEFRHRRARAERPAGETNPNHNFVDPWLAVCGRCPLADCVLPVGGMHGYWGKAPKADWRKCPAEQARGKGWDAAQALAGAAELGLLESEE